jgi:hypothetical protein
MKCPTFRGTRGGATKRILEAATCKNKDAGRILTTLSSALRFGFVTTQFIFTIY